MRLSHEISHAGQETTSKFHPEAFSLTHNFCFPGDKGELHFVSQSEGGGRGLLFSYTLYDFEQAKNETSRLLEICSEVHQAVTKQNVLLQHGSL